MKILVTGGAGFIGSSLVRMLKVEGHEVRVLDALTYAAGRDWSSLEGISGIERIEGDICSLAECTQAVRGMDAVLHLAAESHVTRSEKASDLFRRVNIEGTHNLLMASYLNGLSRFVHVSTDEVYGPAPTNRCFREEDKIEGDKQATSPYAKSKSLADDLARSWRRKIPNLVVVRPTNNFGPRQHPEKAIPRWITSLLQGKKARVWGEGRQIRDWLFVEDCCAAIYALLVKGAFGEFNIGANNQPEITNQQMAEMIVEILGLGFDQIEFVRDPRPSHDFRYAVSTDRIFTTCSWSPIMPPRSALKLTIDWYQSNENWWRKRLPDAEALYDAKEAKDGN